MLKCRPAIFLIVLSEVGTVLHLARSGRLIVRASSQVPDGTFLVDEKGRRAGRVMETIGPVSSPYLSVQPGTERIDRIVGTKLFIAESLPRESFRPHGSIQYRGNKGDKKPSRRGKSKYFKK
jgi:rRNA processing protein Gar1